MSVARVVAAGLASTFAVIMIGGPSCTTVLDLDDHTDAVATLCQCDPYSEIPNCVGALTERLSEANATARADWLQRFVNKKCTECPNAYKCFDTAPICATAGEPCVTSPECCGASKGTGFCHNNRCYTEKPGCKNTGEPCTDVSECCSSSVSTLASCVDTQEGKVCVVQCDIDNPGNCPGCCAKYSQGGQSLGLCLKGQVLFRCDRACDASNPNSCGNGCCNSNCGEDGSCIDLCGLCGVDGPK